MIMSSALFQQGSYDDIVNWIWSLGDISSGGGWRVRLPYMALTHVAARHGWL